MTGSNVATMLALLAGIRRSAALNATPPPKVGTSASINSHKSGAGAVTARTRSGGDWNGSINSAPSPSA